MSVSFIILEKETKKYGFSVINTNNKDILDYIRINYNKN